MEIRELLRSEVSEIWSLDRSEVIERFYDSELREERHELVLREERHVCKGFPKTHAASYTAAFEARADRGCCFGAFGSRLVGVSVIGEELFGDGFVMLEFVHVDRLYRKRGLGRRLMEKAAAKATQLGAKHIYVSATPSENTVDFYRHLGCELLETPDPRQFEKEPEDIHLSYPLFPSPTPSGQS